MESSPLADLIISLSNLHQTQHPAASRPGAAEKRTRLTPWQLQVLQDLAQQASIPAAAPAAGVAPPHIAITKMGLQDDPEAFLELYERSALAWGWPSCQ